MNRSPKEQFDDLATVIIEYDQELEKIPDRLAVKGKMLGTAIEEQSGWLYLYSVKLAEIEKLLAYSQIRVDAVRGKLYQAYSEKYSRELSDRQKDKYIDNEETYINVQEVYLEVKELRDKYKCAVDAFVARGYALKNYLDARVNGLELATI